MSSPNANYEVTTQAHAASPASNALETTTASNPEGSAAKNPHESKTAGNDKERRLEDFITDMKVEMAAKSGMLLYLSHDFY